VTVGSFPRLEGLVDVGRPDFVENADEVEKLVPAR
jgi:hypothetical protein